MSEQELESAAASDRHLRWGWSAILVFVALGTLLEVLHGIKLDWYLNVGNETRRLMWTLAHAHGVLLGVLNVAFAFTLERSNAWPERSRRLASRCLIGATVLIPGGFFLGGIATYGGDPGPAVLLVPPGALLLLVAIALTRRYAARRRP